MRCEVNFWPTFNLAMARLLDMRVAVDELRRVIAAGPDARGEAGCDAAELAAVLDMHLKSCTLAVVGAQRVCSACGGAPERSGDGDQKGKVLAFKGGVVPGSIHRDEGAPAPQDEGKEPEKGEGSGPS